MATRELSLGAQLPSEPAAVVRAVTVIMGTVVGLTFLFGFGNVLNSLNLIIVGSWPRSDGFHWAQ